MYVIQAHSRWKISEGKNNMADAQENRSISIRDLLTESSTYRSPFEALRFNSVTEARQALQYEGTVQDILDKLKNAVVSKDRAGVSLYAPRLIRGVIDYKIANPELVKPEALVGRAINIALGTFQQRPDAQEEVASFLDSLQSQDNQLLGLRVIQPADLITFFVTSIEKLTDAADRLIEQVGDRSILFVALAHGGVAGGLDIFSRFRDNRIIDNSVMYAVRYSAHKLSDDKPLIASSEIEYLRTQARGREIYIFDEDVDKGTTLVGARTYLSANVFQGQKVSLLTTHDPYNHIK